MAESTSSEYYFVPLGREKGSLFDLLGLEPGASEAEVDKAKGQYKLQVENERRRKVRELVPRLDGDEITQEEFDARLEQWQTEADAKKTQLNLLWTAYSEGELAHKRGLKRDGKKIEEYVAWQEMECSLAREPQALWEAATRRRPLPRLSEAFLEAVAGRWAPSSGPESAPTDPTAVKIVLAQPWEIVVECELAALLSADVLWLRLETTNRAFWADGVKRWGAELESSAVCLTVPRPGSRSRPKEPEPEFPSLARPSRLFIDKLEAEEIEDLSQAPIREADFDPRARLAALLEEMLRHQAEAAAEAPGPGGLSPRDETLPSPETAFRGRGRDLGVDELGRFLATLLEGDLFTDERESRS